MALTSLLESAPPPHDMVFTIDFRPDIGSFSRIFAATHHFIITCEKMNAELGRCVGLTVPPGIDVVRVELDSLKTFIREGLRGADDNAIHENPTRAFVASFLIAAKYRLLACFDASDIRQEWERAVMQIETAATDNRPAGLPRFRPPRHDKLLDTVKPYEAMKKRLRKGDTAFVDTDDRHHRVRRTIRVDPRILEGLKITHILPNTYDTTVSVKKADFQGRSKWEVYFMGQLVAVTITHEEWLRGYQNRRIDLLPTDRLHCRVRVEECYAHDGRLLFTRYFIEEVYDVVPGTPD